MVTIVELLKMSKEDLGKLNSQENPPEEVAEMLILEIDRLRNVKTKLNYVPTMLFLETTYDSIDCPYCDGHILLDWSKFKSKLKELLLEVLVEDLKSNGKVREAIKKLI